VVWCGLGWVDLAQNKDQWMALMNMVLNNHKNAGKFLNSCITGGL
jgi:hypothetical protein